MKRFTYVLLGLFTLFGGIVFAACGNKPVSLHVDVPENGITIFTNDQTMENQELGIFYQQAQFDVSVANSSANIVVQTEGGVYDVVSRPEVTARGNGNFTVQFSAQKSGTAKLKIIAENTKVSQTVNVSVFTRPSKLVQADTAGTKPFVLKGDRVELDVEKYFSFPEDDVNLLDKVEWAIETQGLDNLARIVQEGNKLYLEVDQNAQISAITLRATLTHNNESQPITFTVLDKSSITGLSLQTNQAVWKDNSTENPTLQSGAFQAVADDYSGDYTVFLKRNDSNKSALSGTLVAQVPTNLLESDFELVTAFYTYNNGRKTVLDEDVYGQYFKVEILSKSLRGNGTLTYNFNIDALADNGNWLFRDDIYFFAGIRYVNFGYEVTTDPTISSQSNAKINLQNSFVAQRMEIWHQGSDIKNNIQAVDVFSTYTSAQGLEIRPLVLPDEVLLDNTKYEIVVDLTGTSYENENLSDVIKIFLADGSVVQFTRSEEGENIYVSQQIESDETIFLRAGGAIESELADFNLFFRSCSNAVANANLKCNLYHISPSGQGNLSVEFVDGQEDENFVQQEEVYASSAANSTSRTLYYKLKITGLSSISGLSISARGGNGRFVFSPLTQVPGESGRDELNQWVVFTFAVSLNGTNFEDNILFTLVHTTGISINKTFTIHAFIPMENVSVQNGSIQPANVYVQKMAAQSYVQNAHALYKTERYEHSTLSKLTMEVGSSISLIVNHQTLSNSGIEFRFFDFEDFAENVGREEAERLFYGNGEGTDWGIGAVAELFEQYEYSYVPSNLITISNTRLSLENVEFRGYVAVLFHGFDQNHNTITFVRIFALESMFGVQTMYPTPRSLETLYTTESLSDVDQSLATATVDVALRRDGNVPTYTKTSDDLALARFAFDSNFGFDNDDADGHIRTTYKNDYYQISSISLVNGGQTLRFVVTANSTKLQSEILDEIKISYTDPNGLTLSTSISVQIKNMQRVENVEWTNKLSGQDNVYLNLTSTYENTTTISTSVSPSDARDKGLSYIYSPIIGNNNIISVKKDTIGQSFNLSISSTSGGTGTLFLLPNDMIKNGQILVYKYLRGRDGNVLSETPLLLTERQFALAYNDIVGIGENDDDQGDYSNYYLNNNGEKVYNSNIILKIDVVVADGLSEDTAIRIYTADELWRIDTGKYYRIMNNLTLFGWNGFANAQGRLSGMIAGDNENVTITMNNATSAFVNINQGTIKNLTFVGNITNRGLSSGDGVFAGFVANQNDGTIENVFVDVVANGQTYLPSTLVFAGDETSSTFVGGIAGQNSASGRILNSFLFGQTISASGCVVGGIAGQNGGTIFGCGVEFYRYGAVAGTSVNTNTISGAVVGGLVGNMIGGRVEKTYAYAYPLQDNKDEKVLDVNPAVATNKDAFVAIWNNGTITNSFAFVNASTNLSNLENCYVSTYSGQDIVSKIYSVRGYSAMTLSPQDLPSVAQENGSENWQRMKLVLNDAIWQKEDIDTTINFGYFHFKDFAQSQPVDLSSLKIKNNVNPYKSLGSEDGNNGVLMLYRVIDDANLTNAQRSQLALQNTTNFVDLFEVGTKPLTARQARSMVVTSNSLDLVVSATGVQLQGRNVAGVTVTIHNKMDFSVNKQISVAVIYALPEVSVFADGVQIENNQLVQLQNGKTMEARHVCTSKIYLSGQEFALNGESFSLDYDISPSTQNFVVGGTGSSGTSLALTARQSHQGNAFSTITTHLNVQNLGSGVQQQTNKLVAAQLEQVFNVQVYDGATAVTVQNANNLQITPSEGAPFDVLLTSDNENDGLVFQLVVDGQVLETQNTSSQNLSSFVFDVDQKLFLQVSWLKTQIENGVWRFRVTAKIQDEKRHLLDKEYDDLTLVIYPKTQAGVQEFRREVKLAVKTQDVNVVGMTTYRIASRSISSGTTHFSMSKEIVHDVVPASDAILAVQISPAYARMTHFTLTYNIQGNGTVGTVSLAKLEKLSDGTFVINSVNSTTIENGIWVNLTENDKMGDGYFYFRVYVSSTFAVDSDINFTVRVFNENQQQNYAEKQLGVDYLHRAQVLVDGASTYVLAKGGTAEVTVTIGLDQEVTDLYIENFGEGISLVLQGQTSTNLQKTYTYLLSALVTARLQSGGTGVFYVSAQVERVVNGQREVKTSRASVCLVDFAIDGRNISVAGSGEQTTYQGQTYDVFRTYVGREHDQLYFNYPMLPASYTYDQTDQVQADAVENLMAKRDMFTIRNTYKDESTGYYINYQRNPETGLYEEQPLKSQLWLYSGGQFNAVYNSQYNRLTGSDYFDIYERETTAYDGTYTTILEISALRRGTQLLRLDTTVVYGGLTFVYEYYFLVVVDVWSDEEAPTQIFDGLQFVDYLSNGTEPDDYILMNDITLDNYAPLSTNLVSSLDGNGFTIHINSFAPQTGNTARYALFDIVNEATTLKNVRVNIYADVNINIFGHSSMTIDVAGFAIENQGIIYNCEVVSYFGDSQRATRALEGLVVKYTKGENGEEVFLTTNGDYANITSRVSGFVGTNSGSIANSRVGGESFQHVVELYERNWLRSQTLGLFTLQGQGVVSGFVGVNNGYISASFADNIQITNQMNSTSATSCITAGFVATNAGSVQTSYVEGAGKIYDSANNIVVEATDSNISAIGNIAAFVYENSASVKNCYANIGIENNTTKPHFASGFVYTNAETGEISLCFTASAYLKEDGSQLPFSGADDRGSRNFGKITTCYFYNNQRYDDTTQSAYTTGASPVADITNSPEDVFYGFSFSSGNGSYDGIWQAKTNGITLVSANKIALSNRYAQTTQIVGGDSIVNMFYNRTLVDADTLQLHDLSYGSASNPIIIRNAEEFAMAMGHANSSEYSYYREYYNNTRVWGNYRLVENLDLSEIDQNGLQEVSTKLTTTTKTFEGLLDGNGFSIENINLVRNLSASSERVENFGLFAKLNGAVVLGLDFTVESITNGQANIVGTLAGTAVDSKIVSISLSPISASSNNTNVFGRNVAGGVVGMLFGNSRLSDVKIRNINTYSSYGDVSKNPTSNDANIGQVLRNKISNNASLQSNVEAISYAGAVAGYVDTYHTTGSNVVKFSNYHSVSNYDIVKVSVDGSVNVYGEVVGGLFGYVGESTYVYDASLLLNARDDRDQATPSYIISRNLYAGGIVGENYGGLFAVQAAYQNTLQTEIEKDNMHAYYNGSANVERGQGSIFSYDRTENESLMNTGAPLYVGGIAGKMSGGYIFIGVSKLNVVSHSEKTLAVGGVVGLASQGRNSYDLTTLPGSPNIAFIIQDVYASGDLYADENSSASAGGIVGALLGGDVQTPVFALKNTLAENYYSYADGALLGGNENHFSVVGRIYDQRGVIVPTVLTNPIYVINNQNTYLNLASGLVSGDQTIGSATVGGYTTISLPNTTVQLSPYGFDVNWASYYREGVLYGVLQTRHIGSEEMSTMPAAYRQNYRYFLENGWAAEYWVHTQDELFPHIQLVDRMNYIFWDQWNTDIVLKEIEKNPEVSIIVRGKLRDDEYDTECGDIDLTSNSPFAELFNNSKTAVLQGFKGKMYSYYEYMGSFLGNLGAVNVMSEENLIRRQDRSLIGGQFGDKVGLVVDKPLFDVMDGVELYGMNIYFAEKQVMGADTVIDYNISADGQISNSIIQNTRLVYSANVSVSTQHFVNESGYAAGVVAAVANSTSFSGLEICMRATNVSLEQPLPTINITDKTTETTKPEAGEEINVYVGVVAGLIKQNSRYTNVAVTGVTFTKQNSGGEYLLDINNLVPVTINQARRYTNLYAGLYAGKVAKSINGMFAKITLGLFNVDGVDLTLQKAEEMEEDLSADAGTIYVGGFVGQISSVDNVQLNALETETEKTSGITIKQNLPAKVLYASLCFGEAQNSSLSIQSSVTNQTSLTGFLYQGKDVMHQENYVGGFAGRINVPTSVQGFAVKFTVAKQPEDMTKEFDYSILNDNLFEYNKLSSYQIGGGVNNYFGGLFGYVGAVDIKLGGDLTVAGTMDLEVLNPAEGNDAVSVGGVIGRTMGGISCTMAGANEMNIVLRENADSKSNVTARIGGVIGEVVAQEFDEDTQLNQNILFGNSQENGSYSVISGNVVCDVDTLVYGGAIGYIQANANYNSIAISNVAHAGAVKVFGKNTDGANVVVGGVVGQFDWQSGEDGNPIESQTQSTISNCLCYGDVFVIYPQDGNQKLESYDFGGIVGSAPARSEGGIGSVNGLTISGCSSLQTSFNSRLTTEIGNHHVGAIVGANADQVTYSNNTYSSGVNLCYQEENGNQDLPYGTTNLYMGYVGNVTETEPAYLSTRTDILRNFENLGNIKTLQKSGEKLNPFDWQNEKYGDEQEAQIVVSDEKIYVEKGLEDQNPSIASTHGIGWIANNAASDASSRKTPIAEELTNLVFVGNGQTINFEIFEETNTETEDETADENVAERNVKNFDLPQDFGLIVNKLGNSTKDGPNFSAISALIVDADVLADVDVPATSSQKSYAFAGVAGTMDGNAFVYGVGVQGQISLGGAGNQLKLGGIVGNMSAGVIDQCYVDAQLVYRAAKNGNVSGVGTVAGGNGNTTIKATYTSGLLQTYVDVPLYTFASLSGDNALEYVHDLVDDYSNSQVERVQLVAEDFNSKTLSYTGDGTETASGTAKFTNVHFVNASYAVQNTRAIDDVSVAYWDSNNTGVFSKKSITKGAGSSLTTWYFNPYVNYGYASHGFGFLKNVTTYTREKLNTVGAGEAQKPINEYEYTPIAYADLMENWNGIFAANNSQLKLNLNGTDKELYLGVPNVGKFEHMAQTIDVSSGTLGGLPGNSGANYTKNFRFVLKYNMDMSRQALAYGRDIGQSGKDLVIDGNNITLDFSNVGNQGNSLFGTVIGSIENLRLYNVDVKVTGAESSSAFGTLARTLQNGILQNIAVVGNLESASTGVVLGGVVGSAGNGSANSASLIAVESMVNVIGSNGGIYGGVVGTADGANIAYSSNAGQVVANGTTNENLNTDYVFSYTTANGILSDDTKNLDVIVGGVVGASNGGSITHSYNINSALAGYTNTADANYCAGGIVGYASGTTISNSYNSSLVGAGNYGDASKEDDRSEGYAFAGGIVGYGSALTLTENVNSGKVEALGKMRAAENLWGTYNKDHNENTITNNDNQKLDYIVEAKKTSGELNVNDFAYKDVEDLEFEVTLTINPNRDRLVYAYGVGFVVDLNEYDSIGNKSTTDNIKNDGCIGQVEQKQTMTFDRQTVLDNRKYKYTDSGKYVIADFETLQSLGLFNEEDEYYEYCEQNPDGTTDERYASIAYYLPFWGAFSAVENTSNALNLNISGYDSFGFPVRIYGVDRIARIYNDVYKVYDTDWLYDYSSIDGNDESRWQMFSDKLSGDDFIFNQPMTDIPLGQEEAPSAIVNWDVGVLTGVKNINNDIRRFYNLYLKKRESDNAYNEWNSWEYSGQSIFNGRRKNFGYALKSQFSYDEFASAWSVKGTTVAKSVDMGDDNLGLTYNNAHSPYDDYQDVDFALGQVTPYSRSTTFVGYDAILNGTAVLDEAEKTVANTGFGLVLHTVRASADTEDAEGSQDTPNIDEQIAQSAENSADEVVSAIQSVDAQLVSSFQTQNITIDGEKAKLVGNETALESVFNKQICNSSFSVDLDLTDKKITTIKENSIKVTLKGTDERGNEVPLDNYTIISTKLTKQERESDSEDSYLRAATIEVVYRAYVDKTTSASKLNISADISYDVEGTVTLTFGNLNGSTLTLENDERYNSLYVGDTYDTDNRYATKLVNVKIIKQDGTEYDVESGVSVNPGFGEKLTTVTCADFRQLNNGDRVQLTIHAKKWLTVKDVYANSVTTKDSDTFELTAKTASDFKLSEVHFLDYAVTRDLLTTSGSSSGGLRYLAPNKTNPEIWETLTRENETGKWYYTEETGETLPSGQPVTQRVYAVPVKATYNLSPRKGLAQTNDKGDKFWMLKTDGYTIAYVYGEREGHPITDGFVVYQENDTDGVWLVMDPTTGMLEIQKVQLFEGSETAGGNILWTEPENAEDISESDWVTLYNFVGRINRAEIYCSRKAYLDPNSKIADVTEQVEGKYGTWIAERKISKTYQFDEEGKFTGETSSGGLDTVTGYDFDGGATVESVDDMKLTTGLIDIQFNDVSFYYNYNNIKSLTFAPMQDYQNAGYELNYSWLDRARVKSMTWTELGFLHYHSTDINYANDALAVKAPPHLDDADTEAADRHFTSVHYDIKLTTTTYTLEKNGEEKNYNLANARIPTPTSTGVRLNRDYQLLLAERGTLSLGGNNYYYNARHTTIFSKQKPIASTEAAYAQGARYAELGYEFNVYELSRSNLSQNAFAMEVKYSISLLDREHNKIAIEPENISDGGLYQFAVVFTGDGYLAFEATRDGAHEVMTYNDVSSSILSFSNKFNSHEFTISYGRSGGSYVTNIYVDVIGAIINPNINNVQNIIFARNNYQKDEEGNFIGNVNVANDENFNYAEFGDKLKITEGVTDFLLQETEDGEPIYEIVPEIEIVKQEGDPEFVISADEAVENTVQYRKTDDTTQTPWYNLEKEGRGYVIDKESYYSGQETFKFRYRRMQKATGLDTLNIERSDTNAAKIIILQRDIRTGLPFNSGSATASRLSVLAGEKHFVKIANSAKGTALQVDKLALNLTLVVAREADTLEKDKEVTTFADLKKLSNVKLYGTYSNLHYAAETATTSQPITISPVANIDASDTLANVKGVETYLTVFSKDGQDGLATEKGEGTDGENVLVKIVDLPNVNKNKDDSQLSNSNILIGGDGGHGAQGIDGVLEKINGSVTNNADGTSGKNAGKGGKVEIQTINTANKGGRFNRSGADGMPGFGGNGANGRYIEINANSGKVYGGGAAGKAGEFVPEEDTEAGEEVTYEKAGRTVKADQYTGNGGVGGFGRVDPLDNQNSISTVKRSETEDTVYGKYGGLGYEGAYWQSGKANGGQPDGITKQSWITADPSDKMNWARVETQTIDGSATPNTWFTVTFGFTRDLRDAQNDNANYGSSFYVGHGLIHDPENGAWAEHAEERLKTALNAFSSSTKETLQSAYNNVKTINISMLALDDVTGGVSIFHDNEAEMYRGVIWGSGEDINYGGHFEEAKAFTSNFGFEYDAAVDGFDGENRGAQNGQKFHRGGDKENLNTWYAQADFNGKLIDVVFANDKWQVEKAEDQKLLIGNSYLAQATTTVYYNALENVWCYDATGVQYESSSSDRKLNEYKYGNTTFYLDLVQSGNRSLNRAEAALFNTTESYSWKRKPFEDEISFGNRDSVDWVSRRYITFSPFEIRQDLVITCNANLAPENSYLSRQYIVYGNYITSSGTQKIWYATLDWQSPDGNVHSDGLRWLSYQNGSWSFNSAI